MTSHCTEEQASAINAPVDRPLAIIACPGSGKTYTIIHRVAHLIETGFRPFDLLVITFTRKAARELRSRLKSLNIESNKITVQTFHSFGLSIIRRYKQLLNFSSEFRIISQKEQIEILESIAKATPNKQILLRLQIYKTQGICEDELRPIFDSYNKYLREQSCCDFTDLIVLPLEIFRRNPEALSFYQRRYKYALVDEMQDVSRVQFDLMKILFGDCGRITVVGDDDQTIYGWRGADAKLLLDFSTVYKESLIIRLTRCFRCAPHIVRAMSKVVTNNKFRVVKKIESAFQTDKRKKITVYGAISQKDEAALVVSDIKKVVGKGSVAVLFRTRKAAEFIRSELVAQNVNAALSDRARYLEAQDVNIVLNILQMCVAMPYNKNMCDPNSVAMVRMYLASLKQNPEQAEGTSETTNKIDKNLNFPSDENNSSTTRNVDNKNKETESHFLSSSDDNADSDMNELMDKFEKPLESDTDFEYVRKSLSRMKPAEAVKTVMISLNMKSEDIQMLANEVESEPPDSDLKDFLYNVRTDTTTSALSTTNEENEDDSQQLRANSVGVQLSTVHQAKGLEWDYVYIIGATKGSWPSSSSAASADESRVEEERRLFYVAMSRAKKELTISFISDKGQTMFIDEIPELLIKEKIHRKSDADDNNEGNNGNENGSNGKEAKTEAAKTGLKLVLQPEMLKFKKVSEMRQRLLPESQPKTMDAQFISANDLRVQQTPESQTKTLPKVRFNRPQLVLTEAPPPRQRMHLF